jgi:hypothetical protein
MRTLTSRPYSPLRIVTFEPLDMTTLDRGPRWSVWFGGVRVGFVQEMDTEDFQVGIFCPEQSFRIAHWGRGTKTLEAAQGYLRGFFAADPFRTSLRR